MKSTAAGLCAGVLLWVAIVAGQATGAPKDARSDPSAESPRYITIVVQRGDTLFQIARRYGVTVEEIVQANGLRDPNALRVGQILLIPLPAGTQAPSQSQRAAPAPNGYLWPVQGPIMSGFGARDGRRHTGIDISAPSGTPIAAARDGVVTHAGVYYDYGITVMIDHGDGVTTVYGHVSILLVRSGQRVRAGETIARVGCTGRCTGSHVHFELRVQGQAVDPMTVLGEPGRIAAQAPPPVRTVSRPPATPPAPATDRMELERITRGGVTIIRYVSLTPDAVVLTEDTLLRGQLVAREEDMITERDGRRVRIKKIFAVKNGSMTLLAEETVALDEEEKESD